MGESRTKNVSVNTTIALICQVFNLLATFVTRTIFIRILDAEYLGVNGLFTNVLTILSFAELGIGNAIVFSMYKPLAIGDKGKLGSLMALYKKAYTIIGAFVAGGGICVTPFLELIIKHTPDIPESIPVLYILFLANTASSYFFVYKKNIIIADQKNFIVLIVTQLVTVARVILQTIFLVITHQYIVYLIIQIVCTIADNVICSMIADRLYPFLKEKAAPLSIEESSGIFRNVKALALYKFGSVILNGTDNILISAMIGVREVGLVSNYVLITTSCNAILQKITDAFTASVGNLNALEGADKQYIVFKKIFFITAWIFGYASIGLATVSQPFIQAWIGEDYLLGMSVLLAIVAEFYVKGIHSVAYTYRSTLGFFVEGRWSALLAAGVNLVLSIILCNTIGLAGVFIATPISRIFSIGIVDPVLIFHKGFKKNVLEYYAMYVGYLFLFIGVGFICYYIIDMVSLTGWLGVIVDVTIVTLVFNLIMVFLFCRTRMFRGLLQMAVGLLSKKK